jgi:hypothetical protein
VVSTSRRSPAAAGAPRRVTGTRAAAPLAVSSFQISNSRSKTMARPS